MLYYLADGVYPQYPIFARPFSRAASNTLKRRTYNRLHEALRKDVERLYEVTTARFHILLHPAEFHSVDRIVRPAKAVAILHNMVVVSRRDGYVSRGRMGDAYGEPDKAFAVLAAARAAAEAAEAAESDGPAAGGSAGGAAAESDGSEDNGRGRDRPYRVSGPAGASGAGGGVAGAAADSHGAVLPPSLRKDALRRTSAVRSPIEHERLREDLMAHVWQNKELALAPFLHRRRDYLL